MSDALRIRLEGRLERVEEATQTLRQAVRLAQRTRRFDYLRTALAELGTEATREARAQVEAKASEALEIRRTLRTLARLELAAETCARRRARKLKLDEADGALEPLVETLCSETVHFNRLTIDKRHIVAGALLAALIVYNVARWPRPGSFVVFLPVFLLSVFRNIKRVTLTRSRLIVGSSVVRLADIRALGVTPMVDHRRRKKSLQLLIDLTGGGRLEIPLSAFPDALRTALRDAGVKVWQTEVPARELGT